ncbi:DEAD/DEAH box helicase domain-containing protein [Desulfonatronum thiosulfatophilum]|uniref:DEAD/DEAH box helicase domain-containing protein n=1 Tax=Desulfonatronum thiosulfatophilum TaxID=617002 RepID=A0A1G6EGI6_9BACT|nr:DEAD/DEAH box helicase [Desulfonatronum thiosulfatophilum]SDB56430.1 DEAD/DEAH box helicase domain-containing protein [Desulfonatronum thiosulfatophilum]
MNLATPVELFIQGLRHSERLPAQCLVHHRVLPAQQPEYAVPEQDCPEEMANCLTSLGITRQYAHQADAMARIRQGRDVVVATPTASGKSLIYNQPVMEALVQDQLARALYLFPLKALAQDQHNTLREMIGGLPQDKRPTMAIYDGDTDNQVRDRIRRDPPKILITNPDMLHLGILAHHHRWRDFFRNLRFVVIDEVHVYRGVMGSHMAWVFRRLERICAHYGARPAYVCCSATIHNPLELTRELTGRDADLISESTAPRGRKHFVFLDAAEGPSLTALVLLEQALIQGLRTIIYTGSRKLTELLGIWSGQRLKEFKDRISVYRAGFLPRERRRIEADLASGRTLAVISTSALELGIDIGNLDLCILVGYPGSIMATWQRAGRVGRGGRESAVALLGYENPLDKYFMRHPNVFFSSPPEAAVLNPMNPAIMDQHLVCAAADLPLDLEEPFILGSHVQDRITALLQRGRLLRTTDGRKYICPEEAPHRDVSLRGSGRSLLIFHGETGEQIGIMDWYRAFTDTHPGAVYLHQGRTYLVERLDLETASVFVLPAEINYFTRIRREKSTRILETYSGKSIWNTTIHFGRLEITQRYPAYERRALRGHNLLKVVELDLPEQIFETEGIWLIIPDSVRQSLESRQMHFMGGIHALEHACIGILPLLVLTDRNDLGGISTPLHEDLQSAAVFVYDGIPGGIGLTRQAYAQAETMLLRTLEAVTGCACENGCPACVHSPKCGSGNRPIDKQAALAVLDALRDRVPRTNLSIPLQPSAGVQHQGIHRDLFGCRNTGSTEMRMGEAKQEQEKRGEEGQTTSTCRENQAEFPVESAQTTPEPTASTVCPTPPLDFTPRDTTRISKRKTLHFAVLDIETCCSAQEVGGWGNAAQMGVSCAVLYDSREDVFIDYLQQDIPKLVEKLRQVDLVVGFNILNFDYRVLRGCLDFNFQDLPTLDMLKTVHDRLGYRLSLDHLARHTLQSQKSANGLDALKWWKQGQIDKIIAYCRDDVAITRDLYLYGCDKGYILFQNKARSLVRLPVFW